MRVMTGRHQLDLRSTRDHFMEARSYAYHLMIISTSSYPINSCELQWNPRELGWVKAAALSLIRLPMYDSAKWTFESNSMSIEIGIEVIGGTWREKSYYYESVISWTFYYQYWVWKVNFTILHKCKITILHNFTILHPKMKFFIFHRDFKSLIP